MRLVNVNDDLISRTALLNDLSYCAPELWQDEVYIQLKIMKQPTVDAVPVVRCKDCVHFNTTGCGEGFGWCEGTVVNTGVTDTFFCAEGERKEEER